MKHLIWKKILLAAVSLLAFLVLLFAAGEVGLRIHFEKIERITGASEWQVSEFAGLRYFWDQYHPRFGWTNVPGYRSDDRVPFRISINQQQLRGEREYAQSPPAGVARIAMFGNSTVFGEEVDDDESIPAYLEQQMENVEVLNFGVHGYSLGQMVLRLEDDGFSFDPDYVVIVLLLPDALVRNSMKFFVHNKPVFSVEGSKLRITNVPVPEASRQPWIYRHSFVAAWLFGRPVQVQVDTEEVGYQLKLAHALLERVRLKCEQHGVPWTLVHIMAPWGMRSVADNVNFRELTVRLHDALNEVEADALHLISFLFRSSAHHGSAMVAPDGHWSALGNCLIAEKIAMHLAAQGPPWSISPNGSGCAALPAESAQNGK